MIVDISVLPLPVGLPPPPFLTSPAPSLVIPRVTQSVACLFSGFSRCLPKVVVLRCTQKRNNEHFLHQFFLLKRTAYPKIPKYVFLLTVVLFIRLDCSGVSCRVLGVLVEEISASGLDITTGKMVRNQMQTQRQEDGTTKTEIQVQTQNFSCANTQKDEVIGCNQISRTRRASGDCEG